MIYFSDHLRKRGNLGAFIITHFLLVSVRWIGTGTSQFCFLLNLPIPVPYPNWKLVVDFDNDNEKLCFTLSGPFQTVTSTQSPSPSTFSIHVFALLTLYLSYPCFPGLLQLSCPGITSHVGDSRGQLPGGTSFRQDVLWDA